LYHCGLIFSRDFFTLKDQGLHPGHISYILFVVFSRKILLFGPEVEDDTQYTPDDQTDSGFQSQV
jgi:hypothetical protein